MVLSFYFIIYRTIYIIYRALSIEQSVLIDITRIALKM